MPKYIIIVIISSPIQLGSKSFYLNELDSQAFEGILGGQNRNEDQ